MKFLHSFFLNYEVFQTHKKYWNKWNAHPVYIPNMPIPYIYSRLLF